MPVSPGMSVIGELRDFLLYFSDMSLVITQIKLTNANYAGIVLKETPCRTLFCLNKNAFLSLIIISMMSLSPPSDLFVFVLLCL